MTRPTGSTCQIPACDRPAGNAAVCKFHGHRLVEVLADVADWLAADLEVVLTRQVRHSSGGTRRGSSTPLMFDARASRALTRLHAALAAAAAALLDTRVRAAAGPVHDSCKHPSCVSIRRSRWKAPRPGAAATAAWIRPRVTELRHTANAGDLVDRILAAGKSAAAAVDRPADRWFAGPCEALTLIDADDYAAGVRRCAVDLYARTGARTVECPRCATEYDVDARREWLLEAAEDQWLEAAQVARAVSWLGEEPVTADRLRQWKKRGKIDTDRRRCAACQLRPVMRPCPMDTPLYRVGDVLDLLHAQARKKAHTEEAS